MPDKCFRITVFFRIAALFLLSASSAAAQEIQTDFDTDGFSDRTVVMIEADSGLRWLTDSLATAAQSDRGMFGKAGDHLTPARWLGRSAPELGVVSANRRRNQLVWKILDQSGVERRRDFGVPGDLVISGADFNGNGYADGAIGVTEGKTVTWKIWPDMFAPGAGGIETVVSVPFGTRRDRLFYASPDGASDWLGRITRRGSSKAIIRLKNFLTGAVRSTVVKGSFAVDKSHPRPFPIRTKGGLDILGFELRRGKKTSFVFTNMRGKKLGARAFAGKVTAVVGEFGARGGEEIAVSTRSGWKLFSPFGGKVSVLGEKPGIPVDYININSFDSTVDTPDSPGPSDPGDDPPPPTSVASCERIASWPGSHIYKTIGSTHFTDIRRNTIGVVIEPGGVGPFPDCIKAVDTKGNVVALLGLYTRGGGWAARYYAGIGCGSSTPYNGAKVASIAQQKTGSTRILMNFGSVCYGPISAETCVGSGQC